MITNHQRSANIFVVASSLNVFRGSFDREWRQIEISSLIFTFNFIFLFDSHPHVGRGKTVLTRTHAAVNQRKRCQSITTKLPYLFGYLLNIDFIFYFILIYLNTW